MPEQLELFGIKKKSPLTPEEIVKRWIDERAPLIHVYGKNRHIVMVTTLRSYDAPRWLNRTWVETRLSDCGYRKTHNLSHGSESAEVYQPFNLRGVES